MISQNELAARLALIENFTQVGGRAGSLDNFDRLLCALLSDGSYRAQNTITRPSNTTAYTAGDVIGSADSGTPANAGSAIHTLANIGPSGGSVFLTTIDLMIFLGAIPSGMTSFRLHLYNASPTAILDNAAWDLPSGDRANYIGYVDLGTVLDLGSTLFVQSDSINKHVKLADGSTSLFCQLVTNGGYTPTSGEQYRLTVRTVGA